MHPLKKNSSPLISLEDAAVDDIPAADDNLATYDDTAADDNEDQAAGGNEHEPILDDTPVIEDDSVPHHPPHMSRTPLYHPISQVIGDLTQGVQTRHQVSNNFCMFVNFVSLMEPKKIHEALKD